MPEQKQTADAVLRAGPETVVWGAIAADRPPVLRIRSGQTVAIDTVSQQPLNRQEPLAFFTAAGIAADEVLPEAIAIYRDVKKSPPMGPHVLTGPIHIEGAEPGDMLEVRILDVATLQFVVHKGAGSAMKWPRAEDAANFYVMGMDPDLDVALEHAVQEAVDFLQREARATAAEAYAIASFNVDFRVGEAVNLVKMVYGVIPKKIFKR